MAAEITVVVDAFTQAISLDKGVQSLEKMVVLLDQVDKYKQLLGKAVSTTELVRATEGLAKINQQVIKIQQEEEKLAAQRQRNVQQQVLGSERIIAEKNRVATAALLAESKIEAAIKNTASVAAKSAAIETKAAADRVVAEQKIQREKAKTALEIQKVTEKELLSDQKIMASEEKRAAAAAINEEKVRRERVKTQLLIESAADKAARKLKEEGGLIGGLQSNIKRLNSLKMQATTPPQIERINRLIDQQTAKMKHLQNVGKQTTNTFANAASSFQFKFNFLGNLVAAGVATAGSAVTSFVSESVHSFIEAEENAHRLRFALTQVGGEGEAAFQKLITQSEKLQDEGIFSDDAIQQAQAQLANYGLTGDQIAKLIPQITDMAAAAGIDLAQATDKVISGINGQTKGLKSLGITFKDTGSKTENLALITEKLTKFQGANAAQLETVAGKTKRVENAIDDFKEVVGGMLVAEGAALIDFWDVLSGKMTISQVLMREVKIAQDELFSGLTSGMINSIDRMGVPDAEKVNLTNKAIERYQKHIDDLRAKLPKLSGDNKLAAESQIESWEAQIAALRDYESQIGKVAKIEDDATGGKLAKIEKVEDASLEAAKRQVEADKLAAEEQLRIQKELTDLLLAELELRAENEARISARKESDLEKFYAKFPEARREAMETDEAFALRMYENGVIDYVAYQEALKAIREKNAAEEKEERIAQIKETAESVQQVTDVIFDALEKRREKQAEATEQQIADQQDAVERQRQLAASGQQNTLAFEEREAARLRREEIELQQRREKAKKREAYFNLFAEYAKKDPETAVTNTIRDIAFAEAGTAIFAEKGGIAGEVGERVNPFQPSKTHAAGDVLAVLGRDEGILTGKQVDNLGGKEGFYSLAKMLENPIDDSLFTKQSDNFAAATKWIRPEKIDPVIEKLDSVERAIKNIPGNVWHVDSVGNLIHKLIKPGQTVTTNKGSLIRPHRRRTLE